MSASLCGSNQPSLNLRYQEHTRSIRNNNPTSAYALHTFQNTRIRTHAHYYETPQTSQHPLPTNATRTFLHTVPPQRRETRFRTKPKPAKPSQSSNWGAETCAKRKSTSPCLLAIPAFDRKAGLNNRHLNSNRGICLR